MRTSFKGYAMGAMAAASYGLNPLFALPLYTNGFDTDSVLFYRYGFAIVLLAVVMNIQHTSFRVRRSEIVPLIIMGQLFSFSSLFLFLSYHYMDAGIASTLLFVYPVMVALLMAIVFKERITWLTWSCIVMALTGISLLYNGEGGETLSLIGVVMVFLSSLSYALYIIGVNRSVLSSMPTTKLTFYVLVFGISIYIVRLRGGIDLHLFNPADFPLYAVNLFALAAFPTVISLVTMTYSIHYIGSTAAAILGALEPITALFFGVVVFGERLTPRIIIGVLLILIAVSLLIVGKQLLKRMQLLCNKIRS